jgi:hypothetical protein
MLFDDMQDTGLLKPKHVADSKEHRHSVRDYCADCVRAVDTYSVSAVTALPLFVVLQGCKLPVDNTIRFIP